MSKKQHSKALYVIVTIATAVIALVIGIGFYLSPQQPPCPADAIVVVSGGQTTTRAQKGIELYNDNLASKLIFSGAAIDDGPSNAREMKRQALSDGVPVGAITIDEISQNTYENAVNSKKLLEATGAKSIILVSSPYHLRRAKITFEKVLGPDYTVIPVASFDNRWSKSAWWATPFGLNITLSELFKVLYIATTGNYR